MKILGYEFRDQSLLQRALTQSGVDATNNNERLEFIGDRVLGLSVAAMLYDMYPSESEGELARRHALLVSTDVLASVAVRFELASHLRHGHITGGRKNHILANTVEAILGAIFLDAGFDTARDVIVNIWRDMASADRTAPKDPKTALQEFVQKHDAGSLPHYEYLAPTGASHCPVFVVRVTAMGKSAEGSGTSKKTASIAAADNLLKILAI